MDNQTNISIVTISCNSKETIDTTIKSIISQKYDKLEYLIVDGASTDGTLEIIKRYAAEYPYIKYISEPDRGISDAFNKGIKNATGTIIGLINSDDELNAGALKLIDKAYQNTKADVIYGDTIVIDEENGLKIIKKANSLERVKYEMPFIHQSCFITKQAYEKWGGYSDRYKLCMDYDMIARLYHKKCVFAYTQGIISIFRYGGASCKHPIKTVNEDMLIAKKYGLKAGEVLLFKVKHIFIILLKELLVKFGLWNIVYHITKGNLVVNS